MKLSVHIDLYSAMFIQWGIIAANEAIINTIIAANEAIINTIMSVSTTNNIYFNNYYSLDSFWLSGLATGIKLLCKHFFLSHFLLEISILVYFLNKILKKHNFAQVMSYIQLLILISREKIRCKNRPLILNSQIKNGDNVEFLHASKK